MARPRKSSPTQSRRRTAVGPAIAVVALLLLAGLRAMQASVQRRHLEPYQGVGRLVRFSDEPYDGTAASRIFSDLEDRLARHVARAPSQSWTACHERGQKLNCLLEANQLPTAAQTKFTEYEQIARYGWQRMHRFETKDADSDFSPVLQALSHITGAEASSQDPQWIKVYWAHNRETDGPQKGEVYPPTGASFINIYNPSHGIIMATYNLSPQNADNPAEKPADDPETPPGQLVPLNRWSDIAFLTWSRLCQSKAQTQGLKWIFQVRVVNDETQDIVKEALGGTLKPRAWPGDIFMPTQTAGLALLGSPNGNGVAWLLAQHKAQFGQQRTVAKIHVWDAQAGNEAYQETFGWLLVMLFELNDP